MIPEFQTLMLPLLNHISDGLVHNIHDTMSALAQHLKLSEEDLNEWLPSKSQKKFYNYVYWAKAHLKMAGTVENVGRGKFQITDRGREVLSEKPTFINIKYLTIKYGDYRKLLSKKNEAELTIPLNKTPEVDDTTAVQTPEEQLDLGYQKIRIRCNWSFYQNSNQFILLFLKK